MTTKTILDTLGVSKSTYYRWLNNQTDHGLSDLELAITELCKKTKFRYGYRKIHQLINKDFSVSKNTVQKYMQKHNLQCRVKVKKYRKTGEPIVTAENIINRDFTATRPFEKLVTDITYLPFGSKMQYLSSIIDVYNGEIVAYTISDKQNLDLVFDTLNQFPELTDDCILHSDQGSVYTSGQYQYRVKEKGIVMSMSRKGNPADNALIECFHGNLKHETFYLEPHLQSSNEIVSQTVIEYIKFYNETRIQAKLNYLSPIDYRLINNHV